MRKKLRSIGTAHSHDDLITISYGERNFFTVTDLLRDGDKRIELSVSCYLIKHPNRRALVYSGWNLKCEGEKPQNFWDFLAKPAPMCAMTGYMLSWPMAECIRRNLYRKTFCVVYRQRKIYGKVSELGM